MARGAALTIAPPAGHRRVLPWPGLLALAVVVAVLGTAAAGLVAAAGHGASLPRLDYVFGLLRFTAFQAALSTVLSLLAGALVALALARRTRFPGRPLLTAVLNLAIVLPSIVVVLGIVAVFGRAGWLAEALRALGLGPRSWLYGLPGILIAHVFFNAPLVARILGAALASVPADEWRLARHLGLPPAAVFRLIDLPVLARELPGAAALVFLLCFTSFAAVLALGGGPGTATLEVAVYEALRFEADFGRAAVLAAIQIGVTGVLAALALGAGRRAATTLPSGVAAVRPDAESATLRWLDRTVLLAAVLFLGSPVLAVLGKGLPELASLARPAVGEALRASLVVAIPAGLLASLGGLGLSLLTRTLDSAGRHGAARLVRTGTLGALAVPPIALSAGLFVALRPVADPFALGPAAIIAVNALMTLPFAMRLVEPAVLRAGARYGRLAESLGVTGLARLRLVEAPLVAQPLGVAFAIAAAFSLGDLGAAAFFGTGGFVTLPVLLYQRLGAYRTDEAAAVALLLATLVLALFALAALATRRHREAG